MTLDSFFKRIPKQEDSSSGGAAQQEGQASASALPGHVAGSSRLGKESKARGHAGDSAQERRERLIRAAQQRIDKLVGGRLMFSQVCFAAMVLCDMLPCSMPYFRVWSAKFLGRQCLQAAYLRAGG